jgi:DNA-binding NarL/FixJ family response regulator
MLHCLGKGLYKMDKIKLLIVDDQNLMREGLKTILSLEEDLEVIGLAENGLKAIELAKAFEPDVILMDIRMPEMSGVESTKAIKAFLPNTKIIILTTFDDDEFIIEALRNGASGYFLKDLPSDSLISSIRDAYKGIVIMQPEIMAKLVASISSLDFGTSNSKDSELGLNKLTKREVEIYKLMKEGLSNKEIASKLFITEGTVKNYVSIIYDKLEVKDRTKAIFKEL